MSLFEQALQYLISGLTSGSIYAQFDPRDPDHIVFAREDGLVGVLTTDTGELLEIARERVVRDFTKAECARFQLDCGSD